MLLLTSFNIMAQDTRKETVAGKDGTAMQLTGTSAPMYNGSASNEAMDHYRAGMEAHQRGDLPTAVKAYEKAIKADPKFVEAYDNLGQVYRQQNELEKAIKSYKKSVELYPQGNMAHMNLAVVYGMKSDYAAARSEYEQLLKNDPEDAEGYFGLANTDMMLGHLEEAERNARLALAKYQGSNSPHTTDGHHLLGMIQFYRNDMEGAKENLGKAKDGGARLQKEIEAKVFGSATEKENAPVDLTMETAADYERLEPLVIKAYDRLRSSPVDQAPEERKQLGAFLLQWITGSPSVSIEISEGLVPYIDQADLLVIFMGGWTKYELQNKGSSKKDQSALFATEEVIGFYKANVKALGKNKEVEKLAKMQEEGKLKAHIRSVMN